MIKNVCIYKKLSINSFTCTDKRVHHISMVFYVLCVHDFPKLDYYGSFDRLNIVQSVVWSVGCVFYICFYGARARCPSRGLSFCSAPLSPWPTRGLSYQPRFTHTHINTVLCFRHITSALVYGRRVFPSEQYSPVDASLLGFRY